MEIHFKIAGVVLIVLALMHMIFPKYFDWGNELKSLSLINRQIIEVHTFFIAFVVFLMGVLCITSFYELSNTQFGKRVSIGLGFFWIVRLFFQFFIYSSKHWKGKKFETFVHVVFSITWSYLTTIFFAAYFH
jgi:hypothetical protein